MHNISTGASIKLWGRDSSVGIATGYGAQAVQGSNPGGGEIFRTCPDRPWGPPSLLYNGYRVFPGDKKWPGRDADPSPPSSAVGHERVKLYTSTPPMGRTACTEPQCLYKGDLYLYLFPTNQALLSLQQKRWSKFNGIQFPSFPFISLLCTFSVSLCSL